MLDGILWVMKTGAPWRDLPARFGPWQTVYDRFRRWRRAGTLDQAVARLQRDLDRAGLIDWSAFCIDSTTVRASRAAAGALKRGAPAPEPPRPPRARVSRRIMRSGGRVAALRPSFTS
jgi:transposase